MGVDMSDEAAVLAQLQDIFLNEADIDIGQLPPTTTLGDLDIASIDMVMILYQVEEVTGIEIDPAELGQDIQIGDIAAMIAGRRQAAQ